MITRILFGEHCWSLSSSLCSFRHSPVTSSLSDPNILLKTVRKLNVILNVACLIAFCASYDAARNTLVLPPLVFASRLVWMECWLTSAVACPVIFSAAANRIYRMLSPDLLIARTDNCSPTLLWKLIKFSHIHACRLRFSIHLHKNSSFSHHLRRWDRQGVPKRRYIKFIRWEITQKKEHNIYNKAKVWNKNNFKNWLLGLSHWEWFRIFPFFQVPTNFYSRLHSKQDRQCTHNVTLRRVRVSVFVVEKQSVLRILIVCL